MNVRIKTIQECKDFSFSKLADYLRKYLKSLDRTNLPDIEPIDDLFALLREKQSANINEEWRIWLNNKVKETCGRKANSMSKALSLMENSTNSFNYIPSSDVAIDVEKEIESFLPHFNELFSKLEKIIESLTATFGNRISVIETIMKTPKPLWEKKQLLTTIAFVINEDAKVFNERFKLTSFLDSLIKLRKNRKILESRKTLTKRMKEISKRMEERSKFPRFSYFPTIGEYKDPYKELSDLHILKREFSIEQMFKDFNDVSNTVNELLKDVINEAKIEIDNLNLKDLEISTTKELEKNNYSWIANQRQERQQIKQDLLNLKAKLYGEASNIEYVNFEIFPKGILTVEELIVKLTRRGVGVSSSGKLRLNTIEEEFNYKTKCIGNGDFDGFIIYRFKDTDIVIAEKPAYGNATYLVKGKWETVLEILKLSRGDARRMYPLQVRRVIHHNEFQWLSELKFNLQYWS